MDVRKLNWELQMVAVTKDVICTQVQLEHPTLLTSLTGIFLILLHSQESTLCKEVQLDKLFKPLTT